MPDYDYEEFDRREVEWEAKRAAAAETEGTASETVSTSNEVSDPELKEMEETEIESEDDISW